MESQNSRTFRTMAYHMARVGCSDTCEVGIQQLQFQCAIIGFDDREKDSLSRLHNSRCDSHVECNSYSPSFFASAADLDNNCQASIAKAEGYSRWCRNPVQGGVFGRQREGNGGRRPSTDRANESMAEPPLAKRARVEDKDAQGRDAAGSKPAVPATAWDQMEAENERALGRLPHEVWERIIEKNCHQNDTFALASTCRFLREKVKDVGRDLKTDLRYELLYDLASSGLGHSLSWYQWVCDTFGSGPGWMPSADRTDLGNRSHLLSYAAACGNLEAVVWLKEERDWEVNLHTSEWATRCGSVPILTYMLNEAAELFESGSDNLVCRYDERTCEWAASGGALEMLEWLRDQDPPCAWDEWVCIWLARHGHLEGLKWARSQGCPWDGGACTAACTGGHLETLKWLRSQRPACRWSMSECRREARDNGHQNVVDWIDHQNRDSFTDDEWDDCSSFSDWDDSDSGTVEQLEGDAIVTIEN